MAETLETIYLNTSIGGSSELDDGEQTILTTDANTRYVIKDMYVNGTSALTNTYLELNGFNVGSVSANSSGSLIVGPNSTLKIKTTDYPKLYKEETVFVGNGTTNAIGFEKRVLNSDNAVELIDFSVESSGSPTDYTNAQEAYGARINGVDYLWYATSDTNSVQKINYITNTSGSGTNRVYVNYGGVGVGFSNSGRLQAHYTSSSSFYFTDLTTDPTMSGFTQALSSLSPAPTSSYPRSITGFGYLWFVPSSGYNGLLYALNLDTYVLHTFTAQGSNVSGGSTMNIGVSYRPSDDKILIWMPRQDTGASMYCYVPNITKTALDASASSYGETLARFTVPLTNAINTASMSSSGLGYDENGNLTYFSSSSVLTTIDTSGNIISEEAENTTIGNTTFVTSSNLPYVRKRRNITAQEALDYGLTPPSFGIQLLGVKSTNV